MGEHLADRVEVAVDVVEERHVEQRLAVALRAAGRRPAPAVPTALATGRARSRAGRRARTCGRRTWPGRRRACAPSRCARRRSSRSLNAGSRMIAACSAERQRGDLLVDGVHHERVERALRPKTARRRAPRPAPDVEPVGVGLGDAFEQLHVVRRERRGWRQRDRQRPARLCRPCRAACRTRSSTSRKSDTSCSTPLASPIQRRRCRPARRPTRSASASARPGDVRWLSVREVVKPSAPASIASRAMRPISAMSSGVAVSRSRAALAHHVQPQRAVRHLGGEVDVVRLALDARRGTRRSSPTPTTGLRAARRRGCPRRPPSARSSRWWSAGRTARSPTPQLPITTVVTPCHDDGASGVSQVAWPS